MSFDQLRQREKRRRRNRQALYAVGLLAALLTGLGVFWGFEQNRQQQLFERLNNAIKASESASFNQQHTLAVQLARESVDLAGQMNLGALTRRLETWSGIPMSGRSQVDRLASLSSESLLTRVLIAHPHLEQVYVRASNISQGVVHMASESILMSLSGNASESLEFKHLEHWKIAVVPEGWRHALFDSDRNQ